MNELERLAYLDVMGIQQWVPQSPLSNAKESTFIELEALLPEEPARVNEKNVAFEKQGEVLESVPPLTEKVASPIQQLREKESEEKTLEEKLLPLSSAPTQGAKVHKDGPGSAPRNTPQSIPQPIPQYLQVLYCQKQHYVIFADVAEVAGSISVQEHELISNIALALDGSLGVNARPHRRMLDQFKWPMFESQFSAQHVDQSKAGAQQSAQAFVKSKINKQACHLVVLLGRNAANLVLANQAEHEIESSELFLDNQLGQVAVLTSCSLNTLLEKPALKAGLWHTLKKYFDLHLANKQN